MGSSLLHVILVSVLFELSTEIQIYSYRFEVYPVERCPKNISEFETAASRRNCTKGTRYLCAPDKYLSNLIEFCTDVPKSLYGDGITTTSSTAPSSTERYFDEIKREGSRNKLTNGFNNDALIGIPLPVGLLAIGVESKNELPTIIFSKDMLDINSKRIHIEQTPVNENDYTEDGESSEDEHSMSENDAILENKDSSSDKSSDKTARARQKQKMSSNAKRKLDLSENNDEENVESEHDKDTNQSIRLIPFSTREQGKDTNQREDIGNIVLPQCSYDKTSQKGKTDSFQSLSQVSLQGNDKYIGSEGRIENENIEDYVNAKLLTSPETSEEYTTEKQHDGAAKEIETKTDCDDQDDDEKYALLKIMDAVKQLSNSYNFWLTSIDSFSDTKTPVILVGTHAENKSLEVRCFAHSLDVIIEYEYTG
uniref:Uncharacterized protein n=1 Tax=Magallana gigas TaxID=29159 RepID=K1R0D2_MAGGI